MEIKKKSIPIIGIHGWQGNRNSFNSVKNLFNIENSNWFFPQAPYEIKSNKFTWAKKIKEGIYDTSKSKKYLDKFFFKKIFKKYKQENVHIIGFSQGATICLEYVLKLPLQLGGVYPISGFLWNYNREKPFLHSKQKNTPIFIGHGKEDSVISVDNSKTIYKILKKETQNVNLHLYKGGHKIGLSYIEEARTRIL